MYNVHPDDSTLLTSILSLYTQVGITVINLSFYPSHSDGPLFNVPQLHFDYGNLAEMRTNNRVYTFSVATDSAKGQAFLEALAECAEIEWVSSSRSEHHQRTLDQLGVPAYTGPIIRIKMNSDQINPDLPTTSLI